MRAVTSATAAVVIGIGRKDFDNLLARVGPEAVPPGRQGVERRIPMGVLPTLLLTNELATRYGVPWREAFALARRVEAGEVPSGAFVRLDVDLSGLRQLVDERLEAAIETVVRPRRGRPARSGP